MQSVHQMTERKDIEETTRVGLRSVIEENGIGGANAETEQQCRASSNLAAR